jgi:hypothetical protein
MPRNSRLLGRVWMDERLCKGSGMVERRPGLFWPLLLIAVGGVVLLNNFGLLPAGLWQALLELWPVVLILIGLDMLFGRRTGGSVAGVLALGSLVVAGALVWSAIRASQLPPGTTHTTAQSLNGAGRLSVDIEFAAGELNVAALGPSDYAMEGRLQHAAGQSLRQYYSVQESVGRLRLVQQSDPLLVPFLAGRQTTADWELAFMPGLPITLAVDTGAALASLDLSGLDLAGLTLDTGVGQTRVAFPARGSVNAAIHTGLGATELTLPAGLPTRITVRSGIASVSVPARFARAGSVYTTPGFDTEGDYLDLSLDAGVGRVTVK